MIWLLLLLACENTVGDDADTGGGGEDTDDSDDTDTQDTEDSDTEDSDTEDTDTEDTDTQDTDTQDTDTQDTDTQDTDTQDTDTAVVDMDNDGVGADEDCDDNDADVQGRIWYGDSDGDGLGTADVTSDSCDQPLGYVAEAGDCDDANADIQRLTWYADTDADGYGDASVTLQACEQPTGYVDDDTDCADDDESVHIFAWFFDGDGDGHGDDDQSISACEAPAKHVDAGGDCNDADPSINPNATEDWYDGIDQDCSGGSDFDQDADGWDDNVIDGGDCNDEDATINPGAAEIWYDDVDQNCDFADDFDQDRDGEQSDQHGGTDCDDNDSEVQSVAAYFTDADSDGYGDPNKPAASGCVSQPPDTVPNQGDCDDSASAINSDADEICGNGVDENCSGRADEGCGPTFLGASDAIVFTGSFASQHAGQGLAVADFDGDGEPDLAVGAHTGSAGTDPHGQVYLIKGPISSGGDLDTVNDHIIAGPNLPDAFGFRLDAGELDGSAGAELAVLDFAYPTARVYVFSDPWTQTQASEGALFTGAGQTGIHALMHLTNADADPTLELVLSSRSPEGSYSANPGRVVIFDDPLTSASTEPTAQLISGITNSDYSGGFALIQHEAGPILVDAAVNAVGPSQPRASGIVYHTPLPYPSSLSDVAGRLYGGCADANLGKPRAIGDMTGDGIDDVGLMASRSGTDCLYPAAFVVDGTDLDGTTTVDVNSVATAYIPDHFTKFIRGTGAAGDVNGDGYADLWVDMSSNGQVQVLYGPMLNDRAGNDVDWQINLGSSVIGDGVDDIAFGDITGDGLDDLIIPASGSDQAYTNGGAVYVFPGF